MILRDVDFGSVWGQSGVQGFFGEGYWFHKLTKRVGGSFDGMTFVAKTATSAPRAGNMPLGKTLRPQSFRPDCVIVKPFQGVALNAVGLSNPGAKTLFETGEWQKRTEPFFLSFASVGATPGERVTELQGFIDLLQRELPTFRAPVGLQLNFSCPNTEHEISELKVEANVALTLAGQLGIPLVPKFVVTHAPELVKEIVAHPDCDAYCMSNSIPWGRLPFHIEWKKLFGSDISPLEKYGGGALSGRPLLPIIRFWLEKAKEVGVMKPVCAGGGILSADDALSLIERGADAIAIGSAAILRPWNVQSIIVGAQKAFQNKNSM